MEHFKELTQHPKNAEELKGLILQLAVQGKLTQKWREENPDVEPASVLLKKLELEKNRLIKEGKIRKEQPLGVIGEDELNSSIPDSWAVTRLGEIGDWGAGATPSRSRSDFYGGTINWFKSGELNNAIIDYNSEETINELALKNSSIRLNKVGDVLIAMYGATIGETGILAVEGTTNQAVCACTPLSCISNVYLHLLLKALKGKFINQGEGGAQPNISRVKIRNQVFALPPLAEQKAIVEVVNQLFAEVEQLEGLTKERIQLKSDFVTSALNQLTQASEQEVASQWEFLKSQFGTFFTEKANIKKLREAILQLAVQGKLTHHWQAARRLSGVEVEPASVLLEKIKAEKEQLIKAGKIKKEKPLPAISEDEIPYDLPDGWVWCRLGEIIKEKPRNGYSPKGVDFPTKTKSLKLGATTKGYFKSNEVKYIDEEIPLDSYLWLKPNDILIQRSNSLEYVGVSAIYNGKENDFVYPDLMMKIQACTPIVTTYLHITLSSNFTRAYFRENASGTSGNMPKINQGIVANTLTPITNAVEQKAIVEKVNGLMALCDQLEHEIETHQITQEVWMQCCLREVV
ncbi:restriction endonuclease subunit S [Lunatimonas salinarum]|uniref:restriction endonuclease subunit S n=1 Tax=Lunatimonas salinarum TaxID=1774590 RepID=UPI001AE06977|nr:restriction endonuclease subunit S [Lunatimonas salinarum]